MLIPQKCVSCGQVLCLCLWSFPFLVLADTSFVWPCYCCSFVLDCYIVWCFFMKLLVIASSLLFQQLYLIIILSLWITFFEVWSGDSGRLRKDISLGDLHLFFYAAVNMAVEWSWCFFLNKLSCFYILHVYRKWPAQGSYSSRIPQSVVEGEGWGPVD